MNRKLSKLSGLVGICAVTLLLLLSVLPGCAPGAKGTYAYTIGILSYPSSTNPFSALVGVAQAMHLGVMYEPLVWSLDDGRKIAGLAESWTYDESTFTWTVKINSKAKWSDNQPVTAADVKFTYEKYIEVGSSRTESLVGILDTITVTDNKTVSFKLTKSAPAFVSWLGASSITPKHIWEEMTTDELMAYPNTNPVISGAFIVVEMETDSYIIYDARKDYWGGAPKIDRVICRYFGTAEAQSLALQAGTVDSVDRINLNAAVPSLLANPNIEVVVSAQNSTYTWYPNMRWEPWNLKEFRQAVDMGIDKPGIVNFASDGWGAVGNKLEVASFPSYAPDGIEWPYAGITQTERITAANAALDAIPGMTTIAGGTDGIRRYNGELLQFEILCTTGPAILSAAEIIQTNCQNMGIGITLKPRTAGQVLNTTTRQKSLTTAKTNWQTYIFIRHYDAELYTFADDYLHYDIDTLAFNKRSYIMGWENTIIQNKIEQANSLAESDPLFDSAVEEALLLLAEETVNFPLWHVVRPEVYRTDKFKGWVTGHELTCHGKVNPMLSIFNLLSLEPI